MNKSFPNNAEPMQVAVESIGMRGDGIAVVDGVPYYIPGTAPGDVVDIIRGSKRDDGYTATVSTSHTPGPDRTEPACRHFGTCGGCTLQHITPGAVADIKRDQISLTLARHGFQDIPIRETIAIPPGERRRVRFSMHKKRGVAFGFNANRSNDVIDIAECPAARPEIAKLIPDLKALAARTPALGRRAEFIVTATDTGIDILLRPSKRKNPGMDERVALAAFAERHDIARIGWDGPIGYEPLAARRAPTITFGKTRLAMPPDAFLQPSQGGERAIVKAVCDAAAGARKITDLYAGCGALSFPLSALGPVQAYEGNEDMVQAIRYAAAGQPVAAEIRDLARRPLSPDELKRFDTIVFDPPRAGAREQAGTIALSAAQTVIAVSCNPATLARDLRTLVTGGYRIESIQPIDQFPWSAHVEAVAVLRRDRP